MTNTKTIDARQAANSAKSYLNSLSDIISKSLRDVRLEEVELSEDKEYWLITLSFNRPVSVEQQPVLDLVEGKQYQREYKIFKINAQDGEVESMKIRTI